MRQLVQIRAPTTKDLDDLMKIETEAYESQSRWPRDRMKWLILNPSRARMAVAMDDLHMVGYASMTLCNSIQGKHYWVLESCAVLSKYRRRGIGVLMIRSLLSAVSSLPKIGAIAYSNLTALPSHALLRRARFICVGDAYRFDEPVMKFVAVPMDKGGQVIERIMAGNDRSFAFDRLI